MILEATVTNITIFIWVANSVNVKSETHIMPVRGPMAESRREAETLKKTLYLCKRITAQVVNSLGVDVLNLNRKQSTYASEYELSIKNY